MLQLRSEAFLTFSRLSAGIFKFTLYHPRNACAGNPGIWKQPIIWPGKIFSLLDKIERRESMQEPHWGWTRRRRWRLKAFGPDDSILRGDRDQNIS
jgi:hypothetical protein